jgi:hypothetical protein
MGFAAKDIRIAEPASTEALHSLLHVINNEVRASNASPLAPDENGKLDLE